MKKKIERVFTFAHLNQDENEIEKNNRSLIRKMGQEGIVLLENNGVLPLNKESRIALYGKGATNTVYGGSGSGEVNSRYRVSIAEAFKKNGVRIVDEDLLEKYKMMAEAAHHQYDQQRIKKAGFINFDAINMSNIKQGYEDIDFLDLSSVDLPEADVAIYVLSRISGEGADRLLSKGDYLLNDEEIDNIHLLRKTYDKVVLLINVGGSVDLSPLDDLTLDGIVFVGMLGEEMGNAVADVLLGISPSGHLSFSWPKCYDDVPFGKEYALNRKENVALAEYKEDLFVGYRYYSSFDGTIRYPFGYGLSYTKFALKASLKADDRLHFHMTVENIGVCNGKCVGQIYVKKPSDVLSEPAYSLLTFVKSKELQSNEKEEYDLDLDYYALSSFDPEKHCYQLSKGQYTFYLGENVASLTPFAYFEISGDIVSATLQPATVQQRPIDRLIHHEAVAPVLEPELKVDLDESLIVIESIAEKTEKRNEKVMDIVNHLSLKEMADLLTGDGVIDMVIPQPHTTIVPGATGYSTSRLKKKGIPSASFCDGPQGLRLMRTAVVKKNDNKVKVVEVALDMLKYMPGFIKMLGYGKIEQGTPLYQYASAFPCMTSLGCSWNKELAQQMGDAVGMEMEEYGVNVWLAPAMNIHRNPLCGRNYEYISEDPLLSGKTAAAILQGICQHKNKYATLKHFCCNNQESERRFNNAIVSERALREIYLKGFEIAVKEGKANALMSSYNCINGIHSDCHTGTLTTCLRDEWGFQGIVVTDWDNTHEDEEAYLSIQSGITMRMGGSSKERNLLYWALKNGTLDLETARSRVYENLIMILEEQ